VDSPRLGESRDEGKAQNIAVCAYEALEPTHRQVVPHETAGRATGSKSSILHDSPLRVPSWRQALSAFAENQIVVTRHPDARLADLQ
jgi:hypothetical protein